MEYFSHLQINVGGRKEQLPVDLTVSLEDVFPWFDLGVPFVP